MNAFPGSARNHFFSSLLTPKLPPFSVLTSQSSNRRSSNMHKFLHKFAKHYSKLPLSSNTNTHYGFHSHVHKCFSFLPQKTPHHISDSFLSHPLCHFQPWPLGHTPSRGLVSGPLMPARHSLFNSSNALLRFSSKGFRDCRPKLLRTQFHRQFSGFNRGSRFGSGGSYWRSWYERLTTHDVVWGLIIANIAVFLSWRISNEKFMLENFTISLYNIKCGRLHTLITNAFSHVDPVHIIANMLTLYFFGNSIGRYFGPQYLLKLYLAGALGGSVFYLVHEAYKAQTSKGRMGVDVSRDLALGASGAVNAIMLLLIFLFPKSTIYFNFLLPVPAIAVGAFKIGKDILRILEGDRHISGAGHLGGAVVAAIAWARIRRGRF